MNPGFATVQAAEDACHDPIGDLNLEQMMAARRGYASNLYRKDEAGWHPLTHPNSSTPPPSAFHMPEVD